MSSEDPRRAYVCTDCAVRTLRFILDRLVVVEPAFVINSWHVMVVHNCKEICCFCKKTASGYVPVTAPKA